MAPASRSRTSFAVGALVAIAVAFVAVNLAAQAWLRNARLDLTAEGLYTLSKGTRAVLAGLKEPVTLRFYFSEKLSDQIPSFKTYAHRVREMLEEYATRAGDKIVLEQIDPVPFSEAEDGAVQAGIQGIAIDNTTGRQIYLGLVGEGPEKRREAVPYFSQERERFLEYDLTRLVYNLSQAKKRQIGVIGDAPLEYGPGGIMAAMRGQIAPYVVINQLRQLFDVRTIQADTVEIDDDIDVLIVARPKSLSPQAQYAVDQFVLRKGRALVFVDPVAESGFGTGGMIDPSTAEATLPKLLSAWGIEMEPGKFVADRRLGVPIESSETKGRIVNYPAWIGLREENLNREDVVTAELSIMNVGSAGSLKLAKKEGVTATPLLVSSNQAALLEPAKLGMEPSPEKLLREIKSGGQAFVLAARVAGKFKTAFPDGFPPPEKKEEPKEEKKDEGEKKDAAKEEKKEGAEADKKEPPKPKHPHLAESQVAASLIVVADSDLLEDRFWVRVRDVLGQRLAVPFANNGDFVINAVDNLAGSNDLIGLRSRGTAARPFTVVEDLRRAAGERFLARRDELQKALDQTEKQLNELQEKKKKGGPTAALSAEEEAAIERFRQEAVRIRKELREVQHGLERDIEALGTRLKALNIGLMPAGVLMLALTLAIIGRRRRRVRVRRG